MPDPINSLGDTAPVQIPAYNPVPGSDFVVNRGNVIAGVQQGMDLGGNIAAFAPLLKAKIATANQQSQEAIAQTGLIGQKIDAQKKMLAAQDAQNDLDAATHQSQITARNKLQTAIDAAQLTAGALGGGASPAGSIGVSSPAPSTTATPPQLGNFAAAPGGVGAPASPFQGTTPPASAFRGIGVAPAQANPTATGGIGNIGVTPSPSGQATGTVQVPAVASPQPATQGSPQAPAQQSALPSTFDAIVQRFSSVYGRKPTPEEFQQYASSIASPFNQLDYNKKLADISNTLAETYKNTQLGNYFGAKGQEQAHLSTLTDKYGGDAGLVNELVRAKIPITDVSNTPQEQEEIKNQYLQQGIAPPTGLSLVINGTKAAAALNAYNAQNQANTQQALDAKTVTALNNSPAAKAMANGDFIENGDGTYLNTNDKTGALYKLSPDKSNFVPVTPQGGTTATPANPLAVPGGVGAPADWANALTK